MVQISMELIEPLKKWFFQKSDVVTSFNETPSDAQVASEKLVKATLDGKINTSDRITSITEDSTDVQVPSAKSVYSLYESIPKWKVEPVESEAALPTVGVVGTIYLVPAQDGSGKNIYKEFFWNDKESKYEQFGGVELDISKLVTMKQVVDYIGTNGSFSLSDDGTFTFTIVDPAE